MQILIFVAVFLLGAVAILMAVRGQLADLRKGADEARGRENQANAKAAASASEVTAALVEKAGALKEVEAANRRADEMVVKEREKLEAIVQAKDEQIEKLNDFITQAKSVLTTEFKALSGDVLKDASGQMVLAANELIKKHGEKTTVDVELHRQEIETMLKPVETTMKRLDEQVATSNRSDE